jgi:hypothetical protein
MDALEEIDDIHSHRRSSGKGDVTDSPTNKPADSALDHLRRLQEKRTRND